MTKKIWFVLALLFMGFSAGIITGVVVDVDKVYNTTVKKIRQKNGRDVLIDIETVDPEKSKKELRKERRKERKENNNKI